MNIKGIKSYKSQYSSEYILSTVHRALESIKVVQNINMHVPAFE